MLKNLVSPILILIFWTSTTLALRNQTLPRRQLAPCGYGCIDCDDYGCTSCFYGYYMIEFEGFYQCMDCPDECANECEDYVGCTQCFSGYYPFDDGELCEPCSLNCYSCQDETSCQECYDGYKLVNGTCTKSANILSYSLGLGLLIIYLILS